jgi:hypothetical protein
MPVLAQQLLIKPFWQEMAGQSERAYSFSYSYLSWIRKTG